MKLRIKTIVSHFTLPRQKLTHSHGCADRFTRLILRQFTLSKCQVCERKIYNKLKTYDLKLNNSVGQACPTYEYDLNPSCHNQRPPLRHAEMFSASNQPTIRTKSPKRSMDRSRKDFGMTQFASDFFNKNRKYFNLLNFSPIKLSAFTLAEVLIVLGIIGIIAEMTIPDLIQNTQNAEYLSKMKKEYSVLSQAQMQLASDNGGNFLDSLSVCTANGLGAGNNCLKTLFKTKISSIKDCDDDGYSTTTNLGVCFESSARYLNGAAASNLFINSHATSTLVSKDGAAFAFWLDSTNCDFTIYSSDKRCGWAMVDVNGVQNPNTWGKDLYVFFILADRVVPAVPGRIETDVANADDCGTGTNYGYTCSSKYLMGNNVTK